MTILEAPACFVHAPDVMFRAGRSYVHSTTLYEEVVAGVSRVGLVVDGHINFRYRRLMTNQPEIRYYQFPSDLAETAPVVFSIQAEGVLWHGAILERDIPVAGREPYDEAPIWNHAQQDGQAVRLFHETEMRPIEVVTALTLWLHRRLFTIPDHRKWFLSRLDLKRPLVIGDAGRLQIELTNRVGSSVTRSAITADDGLIGQIEFMLGKNGVSKV